MTKAPLPRQNDVCCISSNSYHKKFPGVCMTNRMPITKAVSFFFCSQIVVIRFQLVLVSVNMGVSLPWNVSDEPQ